MASTKSFCSRPGCGEARAVHGTSSTACRNYIDPTSKAGVAILAEDRARAKSARLALVATPSPELFEDETVETPTLSDAELLEEWTARLESF